MLRSTLLCATAIVAFIVAMTVLSGFGAAQVLALGHETGRVGNVVAMEISLHPARARVSALVGGIQFDADAVSIKTCTINPAIGPGTATGKVLSIATTRPDLVRFVVYGLGQSVIPRGVVATCDFAILPTALTSSKSRETAVTLDEVSAADPRGRAVDLELKSGRIVIHRAPHIGRD